MHEKSGRYPLLLDAILGLMALTFSVSALAQTAATAPVQTAEERAAAMAAQRERHNKIPDTPGTGPYPALKEETPSLPDHVIYRPADLQ